MGGRSPSIAGVVATHAGPYALLVGLEQFSQARDRLLSVLDADADMTTSLREAMDALHTTTRFSWAALLTVDPQTLLPTGGVVEGFSPDACAPFWDHELLRPGFNKFTALARSRDTVATLVEATDGDLHRAPIYTELLAPLGVADELRAAFVLGATCWGVASLVRAESDGAFPSEEVDHVHGLAPFVARVLKAGTCKLDTQALGLAAMLVVDSDNAILSLTSGAAELLDDLRTPGLDESGLPTHVRAITTRVRASRTSTRLATRVRGASGRWLRVTAAHLEGEDGRIGVMLEPARATDLVPILLDSYGLTDREAEIVVLLARGFSTKEVAAELCLSPHTVRDHVKVIFEKAEVNSRGELVARLFGEHLLDAFHAAVNRVDVPAPTVG